jgi:hypothetical protein
MATGLISLDSGRWVQVVVNDVDVVVVTAATSSIINDGRHDAAASGDGYMS